MNLSIFSFKLLHNRIGRSLTTTLLLLVAYQFLIDFKFVKPGNGLNQWENNLIRFQNYAYQPISQNNVVLVGSSLTALLNPTDVAEHAINLGMSGGSSQTGLEVILNKAFKPVIVLVEINTITILTELDYSIVESIYNPLLFNLRLFLPVFRKQYQPDYQIITAYSKLMAEIHPPQILQNNPQQPEKAQALVAQIIAQAQKEYSEPVTNREKYLVTQQVEHLKSQIQILEQAGTKVVLYRVPGEPLLQGTIKEKQAQLLFKQLLPPDRYAWIPEPAPRQWKTSDGVHLVASDARIFAQHLRVALSPYLSKK